MYSLVQSLLTGAPLDHPTTNFIAAKFALRYGTQATPALTRPKLLQTLGIPVNEGRRALATLIDKEMVELDRQRWHPGHPHYCFQLRPQNIFPDGYDEFASSPHQLKIQQLLEWNEKQPENRQHQLTISQRLLLMVLLAHASHCGVVNSVERKYLAAQTGTTQRRVHDEIKRLKKYGYIRCSIDGGNFEATAGRRSSIYFIELHHEAYGGQKSGGITVIDDINFHHPINEAISLHRIAKHKHRRHSRRIPDVIGSTDLAYMEFIEHLRTGGGYQQLRRIYPRMEELRQLFRMVDELAEWTIKHYKHKTKERPEEKLLKELYRHVANWIGHPGDEPADYSVIPDTHIAEIQETWDVTPWQVLPVHVSLESPDPLTSGQTFLVLCVLQRARMAYTTLQQYETEINKYDQFLILPPPQKNMSSMTIAVEAYQSSQGQLPHRILGRPMADEELPPSFENLTIEVLEATSLRTLMLETPRLKSRPQKSPKK
jgi:hypothetical protein